MSKNIIISICLIYYIFLGLPGVAPLPVSSSPRATHTGPIKTGGLVQVLDHSRWTAPLTAAIDGLFFKHHGANGLLKRVDADYAAMVHRACSDPCSLLQPTTCQHISRYVKYLAKLKTPAPLSIPTQRRLWRRSSFGRVRPQAAKL